MDPRNTPRDPFGRPTSESATRDPRNAPIPPPPYTLQAPLRQPQPTFANDPFLPRRNEQDGSRQEPPRPISQSPFSLEKYAAALSRESTKPAMISGEGKPRDTNGAWSYGDRMMNGYRSHDTAGELISLFEFQVLVISTPSLSLHARLPWEHFIHEKFTKDIYLNLGFCNRTFVRSCFAIGKIHALVLLLCINSESFWSLGTSYFEKDLTAWGARALGESACSNAAVRVLSARLQSQRWVVDAYSDFF